MRKILIVIIGLALFIQCTDENDITTTTENFTFGLNSKQNFENEISLRINSDFEKIDFISTRNNNLPLVINKIQYEGQLGNNYNITTNSRQDTLVAYTRESNGGIHQDGLRYIVINENEHLLEIISINQNTQSIEVQNRIELDVNLNAGRGSMNLLRADDDPNDLDEETEETLEFFSDPTNTHPITGFFKGIVDGIVDGSTELYENFADKLETIKESLSDANQILINKLKNAKEKLIQASDYIQEQTTEALEEITENLEESEVTDFDTEDFTDYEDLDDNFPVEPGDFDFNLLLTTWFLVDKTENGLNVFNVQNCNITMQFSLSQLTSTEFFGNDCENADSSTSNFTLNGNFITETAEGESSVIEVLELTPYRLVTKEVDGEFEYIETYTNIFGDWTTTSQSNGCDADDANYVGPLALNSDYTVTVIDDSNGNYITNFWKFENYELTIVTSYQDFFEPACNGINFQTEGSSLQLTYNLGSNTFSGTGLYTESNVPGNDEFGNPCPNATSCSTIETLTR